MRLTRDQWDDLVSHAREEAPNECCGVIRLRDGVVHDVRRATNDRASPYGYSLDAASLLAAFNAAEDGHGVAIYHSHPRSPAKPSETDINLAEYPEYLYVIVSLEAEPDVRSWRIEDGKVSEDQVELT